MIVFLVVLLAIAGAAAWFLGPKVAVDTTISFDPATLGDDPAASLAVRESEVPGIRPGLEKEIVWAYPASRAKTPLAIVYLHGFSASKGEIRPLPDRIAEALGANLFFTRLTGHGRDGPAMAQASVNDWINDTAEAIAVGKRLGERVIVIATSTGASLATWAAAQPRLAADIDALVLVSPNYGVRAGGAGLLTGPWGGTLARLLIGAERGFEPLNAAHAQLWTPRYPTEALLPMAATVDLARAVDPSAIRTPAFFAICDADTVIRADLARDVARRWGGPHELLAVEAPGDPSCHVLAGDALSPAMTEPLAERILDWISRLDAG